VPILPAVFIRTQEFVMSDSSPLDRRHANGRFAKGNPGGLGRPRKPVAAIAVKARLSPFPAPMNKQKVTSFQRLVRAAVSPSQINGENGRKR
jgi:hypothetical protein